MIRVVLLTLVVAFLTAGEATRHRLDPGAGRVLHGAGQSSDAVADYSAALPGTPPVLYMDYVGLDLPVWAIHAWCANLGDQLNRRAGWAIPQIGLSMTADGQPGRHFEHRVAAGEFDAAIDAFCVGLKVIDRPAIVRIGYEFNGQWNGYQPEAYIAAWRRIAAAVRRHALNEVALAWCYAPDGNDKDFMRFYPGDEHVDWWSIDLFAPQHFTAPDTIAFMQAATAAGFPVLIGESTPRGIGVLAGEDSWRRWFEPYLAFIAQWPQVKGISYIAWDWSTRPAWKDWGDARLWRDAVVLERWREVLAQPRWMHAGTRDEVREGLGLPHLNLLKPR